jgi:hypothetical protein
MADKVQPIGVCDNCLGPIPEGQWYHRRGPRLYCGVDCRNAGNSRAGAKVRQRKARERVARGEWQNPHHLNPPTPEEQSRRARLARSREVRAGTWRNPALTPEARKKLSRPRKHSGALHAALEKLRLGTPVAELTDEEREAHRAYRRELARRKRE